MKSKMKIFLTGAAATATAGVVANWAFFLMGKLEMSIDNSLGLWLLVCCFSFIADQR